MLPKPPSRRGWSLSPPPDMFPVDMVSRLIFSLLLAGTSWVTRAGVTEVSIRGDEFRINGIPTHAGRFWQGFKVQGLLPVSPASSAVLDQRNPELVSRWADPDTGRWDAERNTRELIRALPEWKRHGIGAISVNLQGISAASRNPETASDIGAFDPQGSLDPDWFRRLDQLLARADELGLVVLLGLFDRGQELRLADEPAVLRAVDGTVDWLFTHGWDHVVIEVNHGCDDQYHHPILRPARVHEVLERIHDNRRGGKRYLVGTRFRPNTSPTPAVLKGSDFVLLLGSESGDPATIASQIRGTRALPGFKKVPLLYLAESRIETNSPGTGVAAALAERASWGWSELQDPPVDWTLGTAPQSAPFRAIAEVTGNRPDGAEYPASTGLRWWKGNLHTHTLWSDGDGYPEMVTGWYKDHGYHFLGLTDHNLLQEGQRWINVPTNQAGLESLKRYRASGRGEVQERRIAGLHQVRLKPLSEFAPLFEEPGKFLLLPSEEITGGHLSAPVHINATHLREPVEPKGGSNILEVMQKVVDSVRLQRGRTGQSMFTQINHPNFGWGITAEDLMSLQGEPFFEVYNGHPAVHNEGDKLHADMERVWDIVLAWRIGILGLPPMFGFAVDDSHSYQKFGRELSNPGRGWLVVRAAQLTPESLIESLERGNFYSSTGVELADIRREDRRLSIRIVPQAGVSFRTRFIGTRRGFRQDRRPVVGTQGDPLRVTQEYSQDIGILLSEVSGTVATYDLAGDELYVRAVVESSRMKENPYRKGETEAAWVQPVIP